MKRRGVEAAKDFYPSRTAGREPVRWRDCRDRPEYRAFTVLVSISFHQGKSSWQVDELALGECQVR